MDYNISVMYECKNIFTYTDIYVSVGSYFKRTSIQQEQFLLGSSWCTHLAPPGRVYPMGLIHWWAHRHNDMGKCLSSRHQTPCHPSLISKPHKMNLGPRVLLVDRNLESLGKEENIYMMRCSLSITQRRIPYKFSLATAMKLTQMTRKLEN